VESPSLTDVDKQTACCVDRSKSHLLRFSISLCDRRVGHYMRPDSIQFHLDQVTHLCLVAVRFSHYVKLFFLALLL
jgi:hypothetical protein